MPRPEVCKRVLQAARELNQALLDAAGEGVDVLVEKHRQPFPVDPSRWVTWHTVSVSVGKPVVHHQETGA